MTQSTSLALAAQLASARVTQAADRAQPESAVAAPTETPKASLRLMSSNVRFGTAQDGLDHWDARRERLRACWAAENPQIVGTQELLDFQADYLLQAFPKFAFVGRSRELDNEHGEQCGIFYDRARFVLLTLGHFWLSPTPDVPGSRGWDAALPRMATWVKLYDRIAQRAVVVVNTHFDHQGAEARLASAQLLSTWMKGSVSEYPLMVLGDFNCGEATAPYTALFGSSSGERAVVIDSYRAAHPEVAPDEGTFHGFRGTRNGSRIDWIGVSSHFTIDAAQIVTFAEGDRYPSDHFPVTTHVTYRS